MGIIEYHEALRIISLHPNRYVCYLGAGASWEVSEVKLAEGICVELSERFRPPNTEHDEDAFKTWKYKDLCWGDPAQKYAACLQLLPNLIHRNQYFEEQVLEGTNPSFVHHATALLMARGVFKSTCITTNFDKLLERAFVIQRAVECQPIRLDEEAKYWRESRNKCYVLKLHGDCDTYNVANTHEETLRISPQLRAHVATLLRSTGLVVIGTAGNERSIQTMLDELEERIGGTESILDYGILWGVFVGGEKPENLTKEQSEKLVRESLNDGVNQHIVRMIERAGRKRSLFSFFPIWGATQFMHDLIEDVSDLPDSKFKDLRRSARRYLDHEKRLAEVFEHLAPDALKSHLERLNRQRKKIEKIESQTDLPCEQLLQANSSRSREIKVFHGDISSHELLQPDIDDNGRRAVVSPDDTCVSAGGGVAYLLAKRAGLFSVLNELYKIGTVELGEVAVTSAGELPVEYIFHAAAGEIQKDGKFRANPETVGDAVESCLYHAYALGVTQIWMPLLASGTGNLTPKSSLKAICEAIDASKFATGVCVNIVVYPRDLERSEIRRIVKGCLPHWDIA